MTQEIPVMPQDANRPLVFGSQIIGVLVVILTLVTRQAELRSARPVGDKKQIAAQLDQNGDFSARLWDDPLAKLSTFEIASQEQSGAARKALSTFGTMEADVDKNASASANVRNSLLSQQLAASAANTGTTTSVGQDQKTSQTPAESTAGKGIFIWNILDARPLPEVKESRLRIRYAVVSAVLAEGYLPTNESLLIPLGSSPVAYYETFRLRSDVTQHPFQSVTLIWIPKQSKALNWAPDSDFFQTMQKQIATQAGVPADGAVRFLNHGSSDDFDAYLAATKDRDEDNVSFMRATIPFKYLQIQDSRAGCLRRITGDDQLVPKLVGELCLRIPSLNAGKPAAERPRVLIFTESDTSYSRAIASEVTNALSQLARVEVYSYLRGLDGRPEDIPIRTTSEGERSKDVAAALLRDKAITEVSTGTSQFDYLRRLSLCLDQAKRRRVAGEICAVGILGSDIYDKMLVLQAIRPKLPAAIFFTTDLDALYLERDSESFTRNLVVASADNLDVNTDASDHPLRWKLPPMRDSYQTVLVKHVWEILEAGTAELEPMATEPVNVFEIVAGKNIELDPVDPSNFWGKSFLAWLSKWWSKSLIFLVGLGNACLVLWAISTRRLKFPEATNAPLSDRARVFLYTEMGIAMAFVIFLLCWFMSPVSFLGQEPMSLEASIWPTVTIRLLAFAVAIRLLMIASNSFVVHRPRIEDQLTKAVPCDKELPLAEGVVKDLGATCSSMLLEEKPPVKEKTFQQVMDKHFDRRARRTRIMWASLGYFAVSFVLFYRWPPAVPARGAFAFFAEKFVLALGVGLYIIHLMYCLDLHLSACTLLRTLRSFYSIDVKSLDHDKIDANLMLTAASQLTAIIGKTLLYPLTILILIIISQLRIFDNWTMTPSLWVTFFIGAAALILASLVLWYQGKRLKSAAVNREKRKAHPEPANIELITDGVFAPWKRQPIFAAIFSTLAVFGSLTAAEPLVRLFFGST
jgi:hypothetical protein